jgi:hypothetical protein
MPRSKQLVTAFAAFWLVYALAAAYEWSVAGSLEGPSSMTAASGMVGTVAPGAVAARSDAATPAVAGGLTAGDLVVLLAAGLSIGALGAVGFLLWRETHGAGRDPGMGAGDDPLWSGGDLDMAGWSLDRT